MSILALQRIQKNKQIRAASLDLGDCSLDAIPDETTSLIWLKNLSLGGRWVEFNGDVLRMHRSRNSGNANSRLSDLSRLTHLHSIRSLSLSDTAVADLRPLTQLKTLEILDISGTRVADLGPLSQLTLLRVLIISGSKVTDLAPLTGMKQLQVLLASQTGISQLAPLENLVALKLLHIDSTNTESLAPLSKLSTLQLLNASHTNIIDLIALTEHSTLQALDISFTHVNDLTPLASLAQMRTLDASRTLVSDATPLAALSKLETLKISRTPVADLRPLESLDKLQILDISDTRVSDLTPLRSLLKQGLPVYWSQGSYSWQGAGIFVEGCPLKNPPLGILLQGSKAILDYFTEVEVGGANQLYEAKVLILGEGGAGKTSLLRRLYQPDKPLPTEQETTKGISIIQHSFRLDEGQRFLLNLWDFGGQEIYHATHQFFLTQRSLYILVDDTRRDYKLASDPGFKYWLDLTETFGGNSPVLIFQNEKGGRSKSIDIAGIRSRYHNVKECYAGNLEQAGAADRLRQAIEFHIRHLSHIGEELPARWIQVRADIEKRAAQTPHIPLSEYLKIYDKYLEPDRIKALHLSRYLHDLGVFLHFQDDPLLVRTVILQNTWATEAVFKILDDETIKSHFGRFDAQDCQRLWQESVYADMHPELLALMQNFELCYLLPDIRPQTWLAPQLLPLAKPEKLADWRRSEDLVLRYRYEVMPKGLISRLTVRLHRYVTDPPMAWTTGVLFEREGTAVLVELLPNGVEIEMRARGLEYKALLSIVAADLDVLNASFEGLRGKVDKLIPCICSHCRVAIVSQFFFQKDLLRRKERGRQEVECPESYEKVRVIELLEGIGVDEMPRWAEEDKAASSRRTLHVFLASSRELREDRDAFELYVRQLNDGFRKAGIYLKVVRWENFDDSMSKTRKQDDYNEAVRRSDLFVSLCFTKSGEFTEEEFDTAHQAFMTSGAPRIYTFFKDAHVKTSQARKEDMNSLWAFQEKLGKLGHFWTNYENAPDLNLKFRSQLDILLDETDGLDPRKPR